MRCSKCAVENPEGLKFCNECGAPMPARCPQCGFDNAAAARFCGDCGTALNQPAQALAPKNPPVQVREAEGERRHLTVLFCDLVGSTRIAAQLDPEEWRDTVSGYQRAAAEAITRFSGHVAKYLGDGVLAFFGYPQAHDDDAERAAHAGLEILDAIAKLNERPGQPSLAARVGIDSGAVVVGPGAGREADVFGDTPNIAARVQEAAAPGTVVVTADTHRLISGLFVVEERGAPALKGIERPVQLYRIVQPSGVRSRLQAAAARGLTPFVGREDELGSLINRWKRVVDGEGQVTLIIGEAGIGKSRLVQRFHELIADTPHTWIEAGAGPFFQNTPFYPITEMLRQALGWRGEVPAEQQLRQLESALEMAGLKPAEAMPLVAPLLNLPPAKYPASSLPPEQQRRRLLAALVEWALGIARLQPTVITTEDLHWADPSTLNVIQLLVEQGARARLLLLYTARPEFHPLWPIRTHHARITLNRLGAGEVRAMVREVAARQVLSTDMVAALIERSTGVPLFVEELTRALVERGDANPGGREIPVSLHDSLMARLDRLGPAKEVIQTGAVIGAEFSYELLRALSPIPDSELQQALRVLADAELLYVRGIAPEASYQFKHALIRDAAYEALLKSRRKELHRQVAQTIEHQFGEFRDTHPEVIARHWTEAGETEPAIAQWSKAGDAARAHNAFIEALGSYRQAITLLHTMPESGERDLRELQLTQSVVWMLQMTRAYSAPETIGATQRALTLAEKTGNLKQLLNWIFSRYITLLVSGELLAAAELAEQALELAIREASAPSLGVAYGQKMFTCSWAGDPAGVEKYFADWLKFFEDPEFRQFPGALVAGLSEAFHNAWTMGRAELAHTRRAQLEAAVDNPYDVAFSTLNGARLATEMREYEEAAALAARGLELSETNRFTHMTALAQIFVGHAQAQLGRASEGVALVRRGIAGSLELGGRLGISLYVRLLASALECEGKLVEALETVEEALTVNPDEVSIRPETFRLRAGLRLKLGRIDMAETGFREAMASARGCGAKAVELRAATNLAQLLATQGRRNEARALVAPIYAEFTESFDTADLKDAKALLDELSQ